MNPTLKVATRFPKVFFDHCSGYKTAANVGVYNIRYYEGRYIQGVIAGKMSKTGVIGYVGSIPIPEVIMGINATLLGMQSVNPKARLKFVFINSWYDPGKEGDAAKALLDQGCDIITQHTDSPAPLQVAEQRGLKGFGEASDMIRFAQKTQLTAPVNNWGPHYIKRIDELLAGAPLKSYMTWDGLADKGLIMAPYTNMPEDVAALAKKTEADIVSGTLKPFKGPIKDQSGAEKAAAGKSLDDGAIASMNWADRGCRRQAAGVILRRSPLRPRSASGGRFCRRLLLATLPVLDHETFLRQAFDVAARAMAGGDHPFGSILVGPDGTVLREQGNGYSSEGRDMTAHAERLLASFASKKFEPSFLAGCTLYTSAEPCAMCAGAIYWAGIGRVVFGQTEADLKAQTGDHPENPTPRFAVPCRFRGRAASSRSRRPLARKRSRGIAGRLLAQPPRATLSLTAQLRGLRFRPAC